MKACESSKMLTAGTRNRFTREQTRVLLREVHARRFSIYGSATRPFRVAITRLAWEQVADRVSSSAIGLRKTPEQCRKRINDLRRRQGIRIFENRFPKPLSASSVKIENAEHQIGDVDNKEEAAGQSQAGTPEHTDPTHQSSFQTSYVNTPQMKQSLGQGQLLQAQVPLNNLQPLIHVQSAPQDFSALCQVHQQGYDMLHKEITNTKNSMEEMLHPMLSSINRSLERLAGALERLSGHGDSLIHNISPVTLTHKD